MEISEYYRLAKVEDSHWWYQAIHQLVLGEIKKGQTFLEKSDLKILDAGCGTGGLTEKLATIGFTVGIDISDLALGLKKHPNAVYVNGSVNGLPFLSGQFDAAVSVSVLYHRRVNEDLAAAEFFRTLRPGGIGIVILPAFNWAFSRHDEVVHTARRYILPSARKLFEQNGFKIQDSKYIFGLLFPVFIAKHFLEKAGLIRESVSDLANMPRWLNNALLTICVWEWKLAERFNFPFGSSLLLTVIKT